MNDESLFLLTFTDLFSLLDRMQYPDCPAKQGDFIKDFLAYLKLLVGAWWPSGGSVCAFL